MYGKIFQITKNKINEDCFLTESTLEQGDFVRCENIIDENKRNFHINNLVNNVLPKNMFELVDNNTIRYLGGIETWNKEFVSEIKHKTEAITPNNIYECAGSIYRLNEFLNNPLNTCYLFYMDEDGLSSYAEQSYEFMREISKLEPGTLLYIGGVINYNI